MLGAAPTMVMKALKIRSQPTPHGRRRAVFIVGDVGQRLLRRSRPLNAAGRPTVCEKDRGAVESIQNRLDRSSSAVPTAPDDDGCRVYAVMFGNFATLQTRFFASKPCDGDATASRSSRGAVSVHSPRQRGWIGLQMRSPARARHHAASVHASTAAPL